MRQLSRIFKGRDSNQIKPLYKIISDLWKNGEQGVWYDPSDLSTMFQDATGTLPCYIPGQGQVDPPVGLLLDKRFRASTGPEMVTNGDFATASGWMNTSGTDWTFNTGAAVRTATTAANGFQTSIPAHVAGRYYLVSFEITAVTNAGAGISAYLGNVTSPSVNRPGKYSAFLLSDGLFPTFLRFYPRGASNFFAGSIDNVSVREIPGNHAYQTTTTNRPTLSARYNLLTNTSFAGAIAGAPGTAPTGWAFGFSTTGEITAVTPLGPDFAIQIATSATRLIFTQQLTASPNVAYSHWVDVLETTAITAINFIALTAPPSGATITYWFNGELITSSTVISSPGRLEMRMLVGSTGGSYYVRFGVGCSGNTTGIATIARPDVRVTNDGVGLPPYQRVLDPNNYDTAGFPLYLRFDGVDDGLTIPGSASAFAFLHNGSGSSVHIGFSPSGGAVYHTLLSSGNLGSGTTVGCSVSQDDRTDGRLLNILNNGSGTLHVSQAAVGGISNARRVVSIVNAVGVHELRQGRTIVSPLAVETGSPSQAAASYDLMIGRAPQAGLPLTGRIFGVIIRAGTLGATIAQVERYLNQKARIY